MITVWLYGALAEQFGKSYRLSVSSPAEAVALLEANHPGRFKKALVGNSYNVVRGADIESGEGDTEQTLALRRPDKDIHFVPLIEGAKTQGVFQTIVGLTLIAIGVFAPLDPATKTKLIWAGGALVLGGAIQMLSPQPNISGLGGVSENVDPRKSFIFTGARNVTAQGGPVPLIFGEVEVGSVVVSQSLTAQRI